jgi:hypothetical protein
VHAINQNELAVQKTVSKLNKERGRAITAKEVREHLGWNRGVTYKYVRSAVKAGLIQYEGGTRERNVKRLLPVIGAAVAFLPSPKKVLQNVKIADSGDYIDPFTGMQKRIASKRGHHTK